MRFSIIIPVKEINSYVKNTLKCLRANNYKNFEVLLLPDEDVNIKKSYPWLKIISTGRVSPSAKRNLASREASGEILAFLDDDAYPEKNWLKNAVKLFKKYKIAAVVGPNLTPKNSSLAQKVSGEFFASRFGAGVPDRYTPGKKLKYVDDWPTVNFLIRKEVFLDLSGFDENFWPGEDTKFCLDLISRRKKILYSPEVVVYHHRRPTLKAHLKQVASYGFHRGYFAKKFPATSLRLFYFIPGLFVLYLLSCIIYSLLGAGNFFIFLPLFVYLLILLYNTLIAADRWRQRQLFFLLPVYFLLSHISYGLNFIMGLTYSKSLKSKLR